MTNDFTLHAGRRAGSSCIRGTSTTGRSRSSTPGLHSNIGQRLLRVRSYVQDDEIFLANYADGLSDLPLDQQIADFRGRTRWRDLPPFAAAKAFTPSMPATTASSRSMGALPSQQLWINGGYFVLRREIFDYMREGEELVEQPFARLIAERKLATFRWDGFWQCMDTFKDKISFDRMEARGDCPWMIVEATPGECAGVTGPATYDARSHS